MAECPDCSSNNAYYNNEAFTCPDCGLEWGDGLDLYDDDYNEDYRN